MFHTPGGVEIQKCCSPIALEAHLAAVRAFTPPLRVDNPIIEEIGQLAAEPGSYVFYALDTLVGRLPAPTNVVIMDIDQLGEGIKALVLRHKYLLRDG